MGSQIDRSTKHILVKGDRHKGSQVNHHTQILALVEGSRQMGFQVDQATHLYTEFWFWLKEIII